MKPTEQLRKNAIILENDITQLVKKFLKENGNCILDINADYIDTNLRNKKSFAFNKVNVNLSILS